MHGIVSLLAEYIGVSMNTLHILSIGFAMTPGFLSGLHWVSSVFHFSCHTTCMPIERVYYLWLGGEGIAVGTYFKTYNLWGGVSCQNPPYFTLFCHNVPYRCMAHESSFHTLPLWKWLWPFHDDHDRHCSKYYSPSSEIQMVPPKIVLA